MNVAIDWIGAAAGFLTSIAMLPQLIKVLKEKNAEDLSLLTLAVLLLGLILWVVYGILREEWPIILSNGFSILVNSVLFICAIVLKRKGS